MNYNNELTVYDVDACLSRPESYKMNDVPAYLKEAAAKAGKIYNPSTKKFENVNKN